MPRRLLQGAAVPVAAGRRARLHRDVAELLRPIPRDFGGGCSVEKAFLLAWLIVRYELRTTVDVGVYRGRSFLPQALAHLRTGGAVYGIDPYSAAEARQHDTPRLAAELERFAAETDFDALHAGVVAAVATRGWAAHAILLRCTAGEAVARFDRQLAAVDLVHVDGNHDTAKVLADVELLVPRLARRGFVVLDDVSWPSVRPAYDRLRESCSKLYEQTDERNDFAIFRRGGRRVADALLARRLARLAAAAMAAGPELPDAPSGPQTP